MVRMDLPNARLFMLLNGKPSLRTLNVTITGQQAALDDNTAIFTGVSIGLLIVVGAMLFMLCLTTVVYFARRNNARVGYSMSRSYSSLPSSSTPLIVGVNNGNNSACMSTTGTMLSIISDSSILAVQQQQLQQADNKKCSKKQNKMQRKERKRRRELQNDKEDQDHVDDEEDELDETEHYQSHNFGESTLLVDSV